MPPSDIGAIHWSGLAESSDQASDHGDPIKGRQAQTLFSGAECSMLKPASHQGSRYTMFIFAQATTKLVTGVLISAVALGAVFVFVIGILALSFRYARANRELLHAERIRAIDAGFPWEEPESAQAGAKFMHNSFWIVVGVPGAAFSAASAATKQFHVEQLAIGIAAWSAAAVASVAAVVCATTLMIYSRSRQEPRDTYSERHRKPT